MRDPESFRAYDNMMIQVEALMKAAPNQLVGTPSLPLGGAPSGADVTAKEAEINAALAALTGEEATDIRVSLALRSVPNVGLAVNPSLPDPFNVIDVFLTGRPYATFHSNP